MTQRDFSAATKGLQKALDAPKTTSDAPDARPLIRSVQAQIDAIARGDFDAALSQALPHVTLEIFAPSEFLWIRRAEGVAEFRRAIEHNFGSVEDQRPQITSVFTTADSVVLFGREQGRIRATGEAYASSSSRSSRLRMTGCSPCGSSQRAHNN
jgi:ketosteroid isomerase-like protein